MFYLHRTPTGRALRTTLWLDCDLIAYDRLEAARKAACFGVSLSRDGVSLGVQLGATLHALSIWRTTSVSPPEGS